MKVKSIYNNNNNNKMIFYIMRKLKRIKAIVNLTIVKKSNN